MCQDDGISEKVERDGMKESKGRASESWLKLKLACGKFSSNGA